MESAPIDTRDKTMETTVPGLVSLVDTPTAMVEVCIGNDTWISSWPGGLFRKAFLMRVLGTFSQSR